MVVWWGDDLRFLYNDAYLPFLGEKHPALAQPGAEVWTEIWETIGPMLTSVLNSAQATWSEDERLPMNRHGYWEETYWTWSFSPLHDDGGQVPRGVHRGHRRHAPRDRRTADGAVLNELERRGGQDQECRGGVPPGDPRANRAEHDVPFAAVYPAPGDGASGGLASSVRRARPRPRAAAPERTGRSTRSSGPASPIRVDGRQGAVRATCPRAPGPAPPRAPWSCRWPSGPADRHRRHGPGRQRRRALDEAMSPS